MNLIPVVVPNPASTYPGVTWNPLVNKWRAQAMQDYKKVNLGNFMTEEAAHAAYKAFREEHLLGDRDRQVQGARPYGLSKYKGVSMKRKKWAAEIKKDDKRYYLGNHETEEAAAAAYDAKALELYGPDAWTNKIHVPE